MDAPGTRHVDAAAVATVVAALLPYCDVLHAHMNDVAAVSTEAARTIIDQAERLGATATRVAAGHVGPDDANVQALAEHSTALLGVVQFEDITVQMVSHIRDGLSGLRTQLGHLYDYATGAIDAGTIRSRVARVDDLATGYVMQSQRAAHAAATGTELAEDQAAPVELF